MCGCFRVVAIYEEKKRESSSEILTLVTIYTYLPLVSARAYAYICAHATFSRLHFPLHPIENISKSTLRRFRFFSGLLSLSGADREIRTFAWQIVD